MADHPQRIAILGAGAVGGMLGVLLADAGHAVTVLATDRTSTAINSAGLTLRSGRYGDRHASVPARPWLTEPVDLLFVTVKAPDLLGALARVPPALVSGATVVPLLNGIDHVPLLRAVFGDAAVTPMTVAVEATRVAPGVIEHLSPFNDYGVAADRPDTGPDAAVVLQKAGLDVDASAPDEATLLWRKLSFLCPARADHHEHAGGDRPGPGGPGRRARRAGHRDRGRGGARRGPHRPGHGPAAALLASRDHAVLDAQGRAGRSGAGARRHRRAGAAGRARRRARHPQCRRRDHRLRRYPFLTTSIRLVQESRPWPAAMARS